MEVIEMKLLEQTEEFKKCVTSLENPDFFLNKYKEAVNDDGEYLIERLSKVFPEELTQSQWISSILLNLQQDYGAIISDLPDEFRSEESKSCIHVGNSNQIRVYYNGILRKGGEKANKWVACIGLHFRDMGDAQVMCLEDIQGELREGSRFSRREVRRIFGKLNTHFDGDWRIGLLKQPIQYARDREMKIIGRVPGLFFLFGSSIAEFPMYSLNYVRTYLQSGIALEDIEFDKIQRDDLRTTWDTALDVLKTKDHAERLHLLNSAANEYIKTYDIFYDRLLNDKMFKYSEYEKRLQEEFARVFEKYLS